MQGRSRDIYGRRATSTSRGRTQQRIMDLQHDPATIPGAEEHLAAPAPGSIASSLAAFHRTWVVEQPVAPRRAYERTLALLLRDLAEAGPAPQDPVTDLDGRRLAAHATWRLQVGLTGEGELRRLPVHLARIGEHLAADGAPDMGDVRARTRGLVEEHLSGG